MENERVMAIRNGKPDGGVLEKGKIKLISPPLYKVILINDDFTPMDFVVAILKNFFSMSEERATQVMLKIHHEGSSVCGVYPNDIAATKVQQINEFSRQHQHPLMCVMDKE